MLMTAILLVERLAATVGGDPLSVLDHMARCFEAKRRYAARIKNFS